MSTADVALNRPATTRFAIGVIAAGAVYYLSTRFAWLLAFPGSDVSLIFPPHAILVAILLSIPTPRWWLFVLVAACSHFIATRQAQWPLSDALQVEAFGALKAVLTAAAIRTFIKSPFHLISLREALLFVLIAVILVPAVTSLWFAPDWVDCRDLAVSNAMTTVVLVPAIMNGVHLFKTGFKIELRGLAEASLLGVILVLVGWLAFDRLPAGPTASPAWLYAPLPVLIWATLRFGVGGMSASLLLVTMLAIWGTLHGRGPFLSQSASENALALQLFILFVAASLLLLSVAIDEERRSKRALRVTEQRMTLAAESAQLALWEWDLAKDVIWVQDQGLFGFPANTPIDHATLGGAVHPDDLAFRASAIQRALINGGNYESEFRVILANGEVRWIAARGRSLTHSGDEAPTRILGIAMDVTRQKQAATEAQQQLEELAHLSRVSTLSALSGSLAHELNQPLTSILGNTSAGQSIASQQTPDLTELRAIFADVESAACRAGDIIEHMRRLLRRGEVALQPVDVKQSIGELLRLLRTDFIARGVSVVDLSTHDLPPVLADRVQLQQILLNLIKNACDAMQANAPDDRKLTLTTSVGQGQVRIGVLDCGVGLPEDLESMFRPFQTTKSTGLGMGLSICRALVNAHRGRLWAERRPERGAAFYVALPLATPTAPSG